MKTTQPLLRNIRPVKMLFADAPANFTELAEAAGLVYIEESTEAGTRYVVDFEELPEADGSHPLVRQLAAVAAEPANDEFRQICLEPA
ncbi:MAG: hypothetical protein PSV13_10760 [Lacunisphaera sp.]|nr:hypothetical protein [Lacunisphaera sp.]